LTLDRTLTTPTFTFYFLRYLIFQYFILLVIRLSASRLSWSTSPEGGNPSPRTSSKSRSNQFLVRNPIKNI